MLKIVLKMKIIIHLVLMGSMIMYQLTILLFLYLEVTGILKNQ